MMVIALRLGWIKARVRSMAVLGCAALFMSTVARADEWVFVWVGATSQGWSVVQGRAAPKLGQEELHFDLTGTNSVKYTVDAHVNKDGTAKAGLAGLGDAYGGITIMKGKFVKKNLGAGCNAEVLQVQNEFNSLFIGKFGAPGCKQ
jgi:hypothetical protein